MILSEFYVTPSGAIAKNVMGVETYLWGYWEWKDGVIIPTSNFFARRGPEEE